MNLMPKEIEKELMTYPLGSQNALDDDAKVIVKYFNPTGAGTWLITEGEKQENGDWLLYGLCYIHEWEWGSVMLSELQELKLPFGMRVERDIHFMGTIRKGCYDEIESFY
jgi:hypothetical protein